MLKMHDKCPLKLEGWARTERETHASRNARAVREVRVQNVSNLVINMGWRRAQFWPISLAVSRASKIKRQLLLMSVKSPAMNMSKAR